MKRELSTLLPLLLLGAAFLVVSALVFFSRGNPKLVRRKLQIGAMMLGINAVAAGCPPRITCYEPMPIEEMCLIDESEVCRAHGSTISVMTDETSRLRGRIMWRESTDLSYRVVDEQENVLLRGKIEAVESRTGQSMELFEIAIDGSRLSPGPHQVELFAESLDAAEQAASSPLSTYGLLVQESSE